MPNKKKSSLQDIAENANLDRKLFAQAKVDTVTSKTPGSVIGGGKKNKEKNQKIPIFWKKVQKTEKLNLIFKKESKTVPAAKQLKTLSLHTDDTHCGWQGQGC